jgi:hypothetical protein
MTQTKTSRIARWTCNKRRTCVLQVSGGNAIHYSSISLWCWFLEWWKHYTQDCKIIAHSFNPIKEGRKEEEERGAVNLILEITRDANERNWAKVEGMKQKNKWRKRERHYTEGEVWNLGLLLGDVGEKGESGDEDGGTAMNFWWDFCGGTLEVEGEVMNLRILQMDNTTRAINTITIPTWTAIGKELLFDPTIKKKLQGLLCICSGFGIGSTLTLRGVRFEDCCWGSTCSCSEAVVACWRASWGLGQNTAGSL